MDLLILQHEDSTSPGTTLKWAEERGLKTRVKWTPTLDWSALPDFKGVVVCGGSQNVGEDDRFPWLAKENEFLKQALRADKKIMGLCLGAQLLANVLGAPVTNMGKWEIGWCPVDFGKERITPFQYHRYTFALPEGAERIGTNDVCANQAFRFRKNAIGVQFHPEADVDWIETSLENYRLGSKDGAPEKRDLLPVDPERARAMQNWYFSFLDSWWNC